MVLNGIAVLEKIFLLLKKTVYAFKRAQFLLNNKLIITLSYSIFIVDMITVMLN